MLLKAIHAQECKTSAKEKAKQVADKLLEMKLTSAAKKVEDGIEEPLAYMDFTSQHWTRIRTNNTIERLNREIKLRTRAIGAFPDGQSVLMLVCARLRHVAGTQWGTKRYCIQIVISITVYPDPIRVTDVLFVIRIDLCILIRYKITKSVSTS